MSSITKTIAPTQPNKTFGLHRARDLLDKLKWDISQLRGLLSHTPEYYYQAINCAITAWQMCDWVYEELTADDRTQYPSRYKFCEHIKQESQWLRICRELADASKHRRLDHKPAPDIGTPMFDIYQTKEGNLVVQIFVYDGLTIHSPELVMLEAYDFWEEYLNSKGM